MHVPSLGTPEGAFDYLMIVLLATTVVFGLFFGALEFGLF